MTDPLERDGPTELDRAAERFAALSARSHVGAAGFAQSQALEQIISAGREQMALTQSLREVVATTQAQLRDIAVRFDAEVAQVHDATLKRVVRSGRAQIEAANTLRQAIQHTLANVRGTPLEDISAAVLTTLGSAVRRQAEALEDLITLAISEAQSAEQITKLERVSADTAVRFEAVEHERTERELAYLELLQDQTLTRIRRLEGAGQTHAQQKAHLEAAEVRDLAQIADLEDQQQASDDRHAALQAAAAQNQDRLEELGGRPATPAPLEHDPHTDP